MESHEQAFLRADDSRLNYDAGFCSLQSEVQMQFDSEYPVMHEPSTLDTSALQESGMNIGDRQSELVGDVACDDNLVLQNGTRGPASSDCDFNKVYIASSDESGHVNQADASDNAIRGGVCIGTIVSVHEQANTILAKHSANEGIARPHKVPVMASSAIPGNRIDYGKSVAMEDFGGEFEDGFGIEESAFASVNVFADSELNRPGTVSVPSSETKLNDGSAQICNAEATDDVVPVDTGAHEQSDGPVTLDEILPKSPRDEESVECDEEPPVLEREVISKPGNSKQNDQEEDDGDVEETPSKLPSKRTRRHNEAQNERKQASDTEESPAPNVELNVNSRPRRSVNRKSVFELLHVDYRYVGGPKKVATHRTSEGEVNHESPPKKQRSAKKGTKVSNAHSGDDDTERPVKMKRHLPTPRDRMHDIDDQISAIRKKVVGYRPDDFLDDGDTEPEVTKNTDSKDKKSTVDADGSSPKESMFAAADDLAARSFLSTFAAESAEALSLSKQADVGSELEALTAENQDLRSRIKALEQSRSLVKKFNIDFHGRKFSRIRSLAVASPDQQKPSGKTGSGYEGTPTTERKAPVETGESMLSRIAVLDRREHKLRELSDELDERATAVKIAEGALRRKERKLVDFEKTLEHRERVLSRHEQSILKRELLLGSPAVSADSSPVEEGEDRQSLAAEIQRRLEQRRQELDRRQAALNSERSRLEIREQELDRREAGSGMAGESSGSSKDEVGDAVAAAADHSSSRLSKRLTSIVKQKKKTSVSHVIRSKYLSQKKPKVLHVIV